MMWQRQFTADDEVCLRSQVITADQPGPLLHDFEMLLDFLRLHGGVEASGKYNLLPIKLIGELDRGLSRPLHLELKHPHLLEAWLRFGRAEMVGERPDIWAGLLLPCLQAWRSVPDEGMQCHIERPTSVHLAGISRSFYQLALMDHFGIVEVERPRQPVTPWCPAGIKRVPFGDAVFTLISANFNFVGRVLSLDDKDADQEENALATPRFGALATVVPALFFPKLGENPRAAGARATRGHVHFPGVSWQVALAADRNPGRPNPGRSAALGPSLGQVRH